MKRVLMGAHSSIGVLAAETMAALASDVIGNDRPPGSAKLRPTPRYQPKTPVTDHDIERLRRAEMKRARKAARLRGEFFPMEHG